nr:hypothetical protein [Leptospira interrogans]
MFFSPLLKTPIKLILGFFFIKLYPGTKAIGAMYIIMSKTHYEIFQKTINFNRVQSVIVTFLFWLSYVFLISYVRSL